MCKSLLKIIETHIQNNGYNEDMSRPNNCIQTHLMDTMCTSRHAFTGSKTSFWIQCVHLDMYALYPKIQARKNIKNTINNNENYKKLTTNLYPCAKVYCIILLHVPLSMECTVLIHRCRRRSRAPRLPLRQLRQLLHQDRRSDHQHQDRKPAPTTIPRCPPMAPCASACPANLFFHGVFIAIQTIT